MRHLRPESRNGFLVLETWGPRQSFLLEPMGREENLSAIKVESENFMEKKMA